MHLSRSLKLSLFVCACGVGMCEVSERLKREAVLSFFRVGSGNGTQVVRLGCNHHNAWFLTSDFLSHPVRGTRVWLRVRAVIENLSICTFGQLSGIGSFKSMAFLHVSLISALRSVYWHVKCNRGQTTFIIELGVYIYIFVVSNLSPSSCICVLCAGETGMHHQACLKLYFLFLKIYLSEIKSPSPALTFLSCPSLLSAGILSVGYHTPFRSYFTKK